MVNRKGWLRIVEASIAILLIASAMLIFANRNSFSNRTDYLEQSINPILEEIAKNSSLRSEVLGYNLTKSEGDPANNATLIKLKSFVRNRLSNQNVSIEIKICPTNENCPLESYPLETKSGVYTEERIITTTPLQNYFNPRKIKVFVWKN